MQENQTPTPGWYPDNVSGSNKLRYWDGTAWTENVMDAPAQAQPQYAQPQYVAAPVKTPANGKAIASLVLGILGLGAWYLPLLGYPITIVGLVMGIMGLKSLKRGMAIAGIVLSAIGLLLTIGSSVVGVYMVLTGQYSL